MVTSADELRTDTPADDSSDEWDRKVEHKNLNDVEARSLRIDCHTNEVDREAWSCSDADG